MNNFVLLAEIHVDADWPPSERKAEFYYYLATCEITQALIAETLLVPLAQQLDSSGLGRIANFDLLQCNAVEIGRIEDDLVVELTHLEYGRELVNRVIDASKLRRCNPAIPRRWVDYHCDEYFSKAWCAHGHFDESSQYWVIAKLSEIYENADIEFLAIGGSGIDGIDFGYRKRHPGLWAYYPIEGDFKYLAATVSALVDGWCSNSLTI